MIVYFAKLYTCTSFETVVDKDREKQHKALKNEVNREKRLITQLQHGVYKAGKLIIYSCKFLFLPAVLVVPSSHNTLVTALITLCLV